MDSVFTGTAQKGPVSPIPGLLKLCSGQGIHDDWHALFICTFAELSNC